MAVGIEFSSAIEQTIIVAQLVCNLFFYVVGLGELNNYSHIAYAGASIGGELNELQNAS